MKILRRKKGQMWVNMTKRVVRVMVVFNEKLYPEEEQAWQLMSEAEALVLEANWLAEDEQARLANEGEETPQPDQPQAE